MECLLFNVRYRKFYFIFFHFYLCTFFIIKYTAILYVFCFCIIKLHTTINQVFFLSHNFKNKLITVKRTFLIYRLSILYFIRHLLFVNKQLILKVTVNFLKKVSIFLINLGVVDHMFNVVPASVFVNFLKQFFCKHAFFRLVGMNRDKLQNGRYYYGSSLKRYKNYSEKSILTTLENMKTHNFSFQRAS